MNNENKPIKDTAFAIITRGILLPFTIRSTRRQCVIDFEKSYAEAWPVLKKQGAIVKKVIIQTI